MVGARGKVREGEVVMGRMGGWYFDCGVGVS